MPGDTFRCSRCRREFIKERSDEAALREMEETWKRPAGGLAVVCDDCYQKFASWAKENHPEWLK